MGKDQTPLTSMSWHAVQRAARQIHNKLDDN